MKGYAVEIIKFSVGDTVELKKPHPCGSYEFKIGRVGSDIRIICLGCNRDMSINRIKLEKALKKLHSNSTTQQEDKNG
jgi:hypothetical protein